ncbi:protein YLS3 [Cocos nucifera]|uniref:Protein YLS3 n=1 Tax=Cocos nucifera TaxID=13894 RepID=A0A8K0IC17_COCNU|nr:protein YLS3 [Cocos nucifera]
MASFSLVHDPRSSVFVVLLAMSLITFVSTDYASDRAECADQVIKLSTCLTYMQGSARAPTPDCCSSLKQVVDKSFKCLCILVKDRNEPELSSFKVNVTLALELPSKCGVPANASACPRLLNLPLNSPDAKIFEEYGNMTKGNPSSDTVNTGATSGVAGSASAQGNYLGGKKWWGVGKVGGMSSSFLPLAAYLFLGG